MGNDASKNARKQQPRQGYRQVPTQSRNIVGASDRENLANAAEMRANKGRPRKKKDMTQDHWERYASIGAPRNSEESCSVCHATFENSEMLMMHMNDVHSLVNAAPTVTTTAATSTVACPSCQRRFADEMAVMVHFEHVHGGGSGQSERDKRAAIAEARLGGQRGGKRTNASERKTNNWERYQSIGKQETVMTPEETAAWERINDALASFSMNAPDIQAVSLRMMQGILQRLCDATVESREKYRKIKLSNSKVQAKIVNVIGAMDLLAAVGFEVVTLPTDTGGLEEYALYKGNAWSFLHKVLAKMKEGN